MFAKVVSECTANGISFSHRDLNRCGCLGLDCFGSSMVGPSFGELHLPPTYHSQLRFSQLKRPTLACKDQLLLNPGSTKPKFTANT
jgi:hypothetical protein